TFPTRRYSDMIVDEAIKNATQALKSAQTELKFENGILAIDKNDPNKVVLFNSAGVGISSDGGNTFKNSITGEGVVAETVIGKNLIGLNITSPNEDGYLHVNGSDAEFVNVTNGRKVEISPEGLYGRNASGSIRFQADSSLVTTAAFGTSNSNAYIASMSGGETRVVDYDTLGGGGSFLDYTFRPIRALMYRFDDVDHGYFTLYGGGEFRFTGEDTVNPAYLPIRVGKVFTNDIEARGDILYLRSNNRVRSMGKGNSGTYMAFEGSDFIQSSSRELKENIKSFNGCATDILCGLDIVNFDYIDGEKDRLGVIAEKSTTIGDGKSVSIVDTMFLNTKAVQEIDERLTKLEELLA